MCMAQLASQAQIAMHSRIPEALGGFGVHREASSARLLGGFAAVRSWAMLCTAFDCCSLQHFQHRELNMSVI